MREDQVICHLATQPCEIWHTVKEVVVRYSYSVFCVVIGNFLYIVLLYWLLLLFHKLYEF